MPYVESNPFKNIWLPQLLELECSLFSMRVVCANLLVGSTKQRFSQFEHEHDFYELHYIMKGSLEICVDHDKHVCVHEGEFVLYEPFVMHRNIGVGGETEKYGFSFYLDKADDRILSALHHLVEHHSVVWHATEQMQLFVRAMINCAQQYNETDRMIMKLLLESFFLEVLNAGMEKVETSSIVSLPEENIAMDNIMTYISLNAHRPVSVEEVASQMFFSARQLSRIVGKACGCTPGDLIAQARVKYIKQLLLESDESITVIANKTGFKDVSSLVKFFRRQTDTTPGYYRTNMRRRIKKVDVKENMP